MRLRPFFTAARLLAVLALSQVVARAAEPSQEQIESIIARVTAELFQRSHFSHHPLDAEMSQKFFDRYIDTLDPLHLNFLQTDIQEFDKYRSTLGKLTKQGDTRPAHVIFARLLERAEERNQLSTNLLAHESFDFTGHDRFVADRKHEPQPKDMDEAKKLWTEEVRYEFLQEKLSAPDIKLSGDIKSDATKFVITLTTNKMHPQNFGLLPKNFYDAHGKPVALLRFENKTNAIVEIAKQKGDNLQNFRRPFYTEDGKEIGAITATNKATNVIGTVQVNKKNIDDITQTLIKRYDRLMKGYKDLDQDSVLEIYLGSLARAYDPHSDYMGHAQTENFNISMKLSLFGIGAVLTSEDGFCKIKELVPGPAMKSKKLKPGDKIVAVAEGDKEPIDVVGMRLDKVVEHIRGPKGTEVRLTVVPADAADTSTREIVTLYRDQIKLEDQEAKGRIYDTHAANGNPIRIGLIDLPSFYADTTGSKRLASQDTASTATSTTLDCARLIRRMKKEGVQGIILDLRKNGGGYLEEAIGLTGLFITKGPVVQTKEYNGEIVTESDPDPGVLWNGPLIVLTSRFSASASEILAGALQDYNRALIVGEKSTFGKGTVQTLASLANYIDSSKLPKDYDPGTLRLTIRKFYRAGGSSTQKLGVPSDISLPSVHDVWDVGEESMENVLPWDEVPSADPENLHRVTPYLTALRERSQQRVKSDKDLQYELSRVAEYNKQQADKSVSLNEAERLAEKKKQQAKDEARTKEIATRPKSTDKVYELTQENVNLAGLQPPKPKNGDTASTSASAVADEEAPDVGEEAVANEARLRETKNILIDYIGMLTKADGIAAHGATTSTTK